MQINEMQLSDYGKYQQMRYGLREHDDWTTNALLGSQEYEELVNKVGSLPFDEVCQRVLKESLLSLIHASDSLTPANLLVQSIQELNHQSATQVSQLQSELLSVQQTNGTLAAENAQLRSELESTQTTAKDLERQKLHLCRIALINQIDDDRCFYFVPQEGIPNLNIPIKLSDDLVRELSNISPHREQVGNIAGGIFNNTQSTIFKIETVSWQHQGGKISVTADADLNRPGEIAIHTHVVENAFGEASFGDVKSCLLGPAFIDPAIGTPDPSKRMFAIVSYHPRTNAKRLDVYIHDLNQAKPGIDLTTTLKTNGMGLIRLGSCVVAK